MKKFLLLLGLSLGGIPIFAQNVIKKAPDSTNMAFIKAKVLLNPKSKYYNPKEGFLIYQQFAQKGNAKAMNGLANLYNNGQGVAVDEAEALKWYLKAAEAGYTIAWYNLGSMYKAGIGTSQNFEKAYEIFSKGASLKNGSCLYAQGYMLYKGLGVAQNYEKAVQQFQKGVSVHNKSSYYMLGLCFRNGYGITKNADSAKYYLSKAAKGNDKRAIEELQSIEPENSNANFIEPPQPPAQFATPIKLKAGFKKTIQTVKKNNVIDGNYDGFVIKFDWSGKHIISQTRMQLSLEKNSKGELFGQWQEDGQDLVYVNAKLTDTALIFNATEQEHKDHYHQKNKLQLTFERAYLNMVQSSDTIYLSGHIKVYSPKAKEPEKERLIMLVRTSALPNLIPTLNNTDLVAKSAEEEKLDELALALKVYPNPFFDNTNVKYTLRTSATVTIIVTDVLSGKTVSRNQLGFQQSGEYTFPLSVPSRPGNYVVTLQYNNKLKSLMVIKK